MCIGAAQFCGVALRHTTPGGSGWRVNAHQRRRARAPRSGTPRARVKAECMPARGLLLLGRRFGAQRGVTARDRWRTLKRLARSRRTCVTFYHSHGWRGRRHLLTPRHIAFYCSVFSPVTELWMCPAPVDAVQRQWAPPRPPSRGLSGSGIAHLSLIGTGCQPPVAPLPAAPAEEGGGPIAPGSMPPSLASSIMVV